MFMPAAEVLLNREFIMQPSYHLLIGLLIISLLPVLFLGGLLILSKITKDKNKNE